MVQDKRTIKTERAIRSTFISLLHKKDIGRITVSDICEGACISRNTFYSHYEDKYLLIQAMSKDFIGDLLNEVIAKNVISTYQSAISTTAWLFFDYLNEHGDEVRLLSKNDPQFWQVFTGEMQTFMMSFSGTDDRNKVFVIYSSYAFTGCYREYFEGRITMKPSDFVQYLIEIAGRSNTFMQKEE